MSKGRRRARQDEEVSGRPSIFFIVALAVGVALLAWAFIANIGKPVAAPQKTPPAQQQPHR